MIGIVRILVMAKYVGTTEAANLLAISPRRLRTLLAEGRVFGAYKSGKFWLIPLYNGLPVIERRSRKKQPGTWRTSKTPALTKIEVNRRQIDQNRQQMPQNREPVISVKQGKSNIYGYQVEICGASRIIYRPDHSRCSGATLWIETYAETIFVGNSIPASELFAVGG